MFGAPCSCVVSKSMCWRRVRRVGAGDLGLRRPRRRAASPCAPCRARSRSRRRPSRGARRGRPRRAGRRRSTTSRSCPGRRRSAAARSGPTTSSTTVLSSVSARPSAGEVLLPDLGLGALLEHDQHAPLQRGAGGGGDRGQEDRRLDAHAARDVDERAAGPAGVVERRRRRRRPATMRAEVRLDQLGVLLATATPSGSTITPSSRSPRSATAAVDLRRADARPSGASKQRARRVDARVTLAGAAAANASRSKLRRGR